MSIAFSSRSALDRNSAGNQKRGIPFNNCTLDAMDTDGTGADLAPNPTSNAGNAMMASDKTTDDIESAIVVNQTRPNASSRLDNNCFLDSMTFARLPRMVEKQRALDALPNLQEKGGWIAEMNQERELGEISVSGQDHRMLASACSCCDEVDGPSRRRRLEIPLVIQDAILKHKRQKRELLPLRRTQHRVLMKREGPVSIWKWTLPQNAEPLVEFGTSHRLIWVQRLPPRSIIQSIGRGIVGSREEEQQRRQVEWEHGQVYLIPSNGGKAVGWIHHAAADQDSAPTSTKESASNNMYTDVNNKKESDVPIGPVVLFIAKVPSDHLGANSVVVNNHNSHDGAAQALLWMELVKDICRRTLQGKTTNSTEKENSVNSICINQQDAKVLQSIMQS